MVLLDDNAYVMPYNKTVRILMFQYYLNSILLQNSTLKVKRALSTKVIDTISWLKLLNKNYPKLYNEISEITLTNEDEINLILTNQATKVMLGNKNTLEKLKILQKFKELVIENNKISDIAI